MSVEHRTVPQRRCGQVPIRPAHRDSSLRCDLRVLVNTGPADVPHVRSRSGSNPSSASRSAGGRTPEPDGLYPASAPGVIPEHWPSRRSLPPETDRQSQPKDRRCG
jgi:hypothetical protein